MASKCPVTVSMLFYMASLGSSLALTPVVAANEEVNQVTSHEVACDEVANESDASDQAPPTNPPMLIRQLNLARWQMGVSYLQAHPDEPVYKLYDHGYWQYEVQREDERFYGITYYRGDMVERFEVYASSPFGKTCG